MIHTSESWFATNPEDETLICVIAKDDVRLIHRSKMAEYYPTFKWHRKDVAHHIPAETGRDLVDVFVNEGRWIVKCPSNPRCRGGQFASRHDRRFFCIDCLNVEFGGKFINVRWPKDVEGIEKYLNERLFPETRHWVRGETADDLARENAENLR